MQAICLPSNDVRVAREVSHNLELVFICYTVRIRHSQPLSCLCKRYLQHITHIGNCDLKSLHYQSYLILMAALHEFKGVSCFCSLHIGPVIRIVCPGHDVMILLFIVLQGSLLTKYYSSTLLASKMIIVNIASIHRYYNLIQQKHKGYSFFNARYFQLPLVSYIRRYMRHTWHVYHKNLIYFVVVMMQQLKIFIRSKLFIHNIWRYNLCAHIDDEVDSHFASCNSEVNEIQCK